MDNYLFDGIPYQIRFKSLSIDLEHTSGLTPHLACSMGKDLGDFK